MDVVRQGFSLYRDLQLSIAIAVDPKQHFGRFRSYIPTLSYSLIQNIYHKFIIQPPEHNNPLPTSPVSYLQTFYSEESCRRSARAVGRMVQRCMQKLETSVRLRNYRVTNMMASCQFPFQVKIEDIAKKYKQASCELELASGLVWKNDEPKATLRIHTTGSVTILGGKLFGDFWGICGFCEIFEVFES
jgi:hypothetical protein